MKVAMATRSAPDAAGISRHCETYTNAGRVLCKQPARRDPWDNRPIVAEALMRCTRQHSTPPRGGGFATHPSLVLDLDPEELDRLRSEESLAGIGERAGCCIHRHLSKEREKTVPLTSLKRKHAASMSSVHTWTPAFTTCSTESEGGWVAGRLHGHHDVAMQD